ncbi:MAG: hypothetical protein HFJ94_00855 [Muribaculaceae bacterium]|jgi:transcriptional regulator of arginine metabolism|nr:hypothetical protein [Muribaculaceae bacterium]
MNKRQTRLTTIADILLNNIVGSQEELLDLLRQRDCTVTQATLSRDLKTLRTSKVATEMGGYRYVIGSGLPTDKVIEQAAVDKVSRVAIESVVCSGQLVIVKTRNGYAGGVAYDIDDLDSPYILGTIAGADTVFVALRDKAPMSEVCSALAQVIPPSLIENATIHY